MRTITLEIKQRKGGSKKVRVPIEMYLESQIFFPPEPRVEKESDVLDIRGLMLNHRKRDAKGLFTE